MEAIQEQQVQWQENQEEASQNTLRDFTRQYEALKLESQQCLQAQAQAFEAQQHRSSEFFEQGLREAPTTNDSLKDENFELVAVQHQHCQAWSVPKLGVLGLCHGFPQPERVASSRLVSWSMS